jgi:glycosyltransferase involved in cell wall biosynthesis
LRPYVSWADVVHLYAVYSFPTLPTLLCGRLLGKPVVWSPLGALQRWEHSRRRGLKAIWDAAWFHGANLERTVLAFASETERQGTLARFPGLRTAVMPHGVEMPADLVHSASNGELRLLFLGRLDPIKGIEALLEACKIVSENQGFRWSLTIAGTGADLYIAGLRRQIAVLGLDTRVHMVGEVVGDAKKRLFDNSDVIVVPSHTESFGLVVAEALAHGVPVIASKYTPWSALEEKGCGLWVENDPQTLADAICRASALPLREMGERGREWMRRDFSWQSATQKMLDLYASLLDSAPSN